MLRKGFTLVEVLLSISVISALFIVTVSKVDIGDIFAKLLSTEGELGSRAIGEALTNYRWDNGGDVPGNSNMSSTLKTICKETVSQSDCIAASGVHLNDITPDYLTKLPVLQGYEEQTIDTGYRAAFPVGAGGRLVVENADGSERFEH